MIYKLSFLSFILLTFTSCGTVETSSPNKEKDPIQTTDTKTTDVKVTCTPTNNSSLFNQKQQINSMNIEVEDSLKLLLKNSPTKIQKTIFNKEGLYTLFKTEYFWADKTPKNLDINNYNEPQELIKDARYKEDKWSFAITPKAYTNVTSQKSVGIGFSCQDMREGCLITYVKLDSPADKIDLRRGDIIQKVNNQTATQKLIYDKGKESKELTFTLLRHNSNEECRGTVLPREYNYSVVASKTLQTPKNETVAYLRLDSFLGEEKIEAQLEDVFNRFKQESIEKLVIDLRYNGGGSVSLASKLLNKFVVHKEGETQFTLAWNEEYKKENEPYLFKKTANALDLKQILFLTTKNSASASELIISAMMPYLPEEDVVIIGDSTHGKPVGMRGKSDTNYYYFLINFVVKNSLGFYDYFDGIPVTGGCNIKDDPFHEMGDKNEAMLKSALKYIDEGSCQ